MAVTVKHHRGDGRLTAAGPEALLLGIMFGQFQKLEGCVTCLSVRIR